jgi:hypothetical protein
MASVSASWNRLASPVGPMTVDSEKLTAFTYRWVLTANTGERAIVTQTTRVCRVRLNENQTNVWRANRSAHCLPSCPAYRPPGTTVSVIMKKLLRNNYSRQFHWQSSKGVCWVVLRLFHCVLEACHPARYDGDAVMCIRNRHGRCGWLESAILLVTRGD